MKREQRYGIKSLQKDFPTEARVLEFLFDAQHSRECNCGGSYSLKTGRRQFQCSKCRYQIAPTANTLFHKSDTPLTLWFKAILTFSNAKSGISAKEISKDGRGWVRKQLVYQLQDPDVNPNHIRLVELVGKHVGAFIERIELDAGEHTRRHLAQDFLKD